MLCSQLWRKACCLSSAAAATGREARRSVFWVCRTALRSGALPGVLSCENKVAAQLDTASLGGVPQGPARAHGLPLGPARVGCGNRQPNSQPNAVHRFGADNGKGGAWLVCPGGSNLGHVTGDMCSTSLPSQHFFTERHIQRHSQNPELKHCLASCPAGVRRGARRPDAHVRGHLHAGEAMILSENTMILSENTMILSENNKNKVV